MPLRSREFITMKRTYIAIIAMNIFTVLYNLPFWFHFGDFSTKTEFSKSWFFQTFYSETPEFVIFHCLPLILIICGNIAVCVSLRKFNKARKGLHADSGTNVKEISITKITLLIIGLDLITNFLLVIGHTSLYWVLN